MRSPSAIRLRILGKGRVQIQAIEELRSLPVDHPLKESILELVYGLLETIEDLAEALLDFNHTEDLISWLENYS